MSLESNIPNHDNSFYKQVIRKNSKYGIHDLYKYNSNMPALVVIEFIWKDINSIFDNLDQENLNFIAKRRIPILFYFPTEGFCIKEEGWTVTLAEQFKKYNLQKNLKYFITGNLLNTDFDIFDKTYSLNCFERVLNTATECDDLLTFKRLKLRKPYDFLSYNANPRPGRNALASEILRLGLNENALFSWIGGSTWKFDKPNRIASLEFLNAPGKNYFKRIFKKGFTPYVLDVDKHTKSEVINFVNIDHYCNSYFSLVSETETSDQCIFITEKTYKAIYAGHPFILWGNPGMLKYLRSIGYKTFPTLFDESYDTELDPVKRLAMILAEVKKFKELSIIEKQQLIKMQNDIVEHNYQHLLSRWDTSFDIDIDWIIKDIINDIKENKDRL
jgi:hypothetical protein